MNSEVKFTLSGTDYEFMLAVDTNGRKQWQVQQLFTQPPSLLKNKIDMTIKAAPSMREGDNVPITDKDIETVLGELRILIDGDTITLTGFDGETYYVTLDPKSTNAQSVVDESGRITEYNIDISCWDLYQAS